MASGVVKVGRRTYAVGLIWQPSPSGRVAQAAREAAQQPGQKSDFYCVRPATKTVSVPQYGLGQSATGHKIGMPALAASLANGQPGSWAGAFRLREGTWFVVVRDDLIAPDGDILFDNDELARDRLLQEVGLGGVQRIYAPDGWAVPGSDPTPLPLLLQDRVDCRLQPVHLPMRLIIFGAGAVALIVLLIFLALQWQADQEKAEAERLRLEQLARETILRQQGAVTRAMEKFEWPPAEQLYEHKWEKQPLPGEMLKNCKSLFAKIDATQSGWNRGTIECRGGALSVQWNRAKRDYGIVPDHASIKEDLSSANQRLESDMLSVRGVETLLQEVDITTRALNQNWPVNMTRLPDDAPPPPPPNVKDPPPPPPPPWRKRGVRYTGKAPPWEIWKYFDGVPGMIIEKITLEGANWTMEATIYEMRGGA